MNSSRKRRNYVSSQNFNFMRQSSLVACVVVAVSCLAILTQEPDRSWLYIPDSAYSDKNTEMPPPIVFKLNLNSAQESELSLLPKIGPKTSKKIVEYRNKNGPFKSVDDLQNVKGIGPKTLEKLRPLCYVIQPNEQNNEE